MPNHRKPLALKLAHGNPGKRPLNLNEPAFSGAPKCPSWLPLEAKREWRRVFPLLQEFNVLKATDQAIFAAYCVSFARWQSAEGTVAEEGQTVREPVVSRSGYDTGKYKVKVHPAVAIAKAERQSMQRFAALLGLDPSNRSRIQAGSPVDPMAPADESEDDDFLFNSPSVN